VASEDRHLLADVRLDLRHAALRPVYAPAVERGRTPNGRGRLVDLGVALGRDNLAQAVILRLLTPRGELEALGHPSYGSRLHELIGRQNTEGTRNLARLHILESLGSEPRIDEVLELVVAPSSSHRDRVDVRLAVRPVGVSGAVIIGPFTLELGT
jgi:phage baseplate assembly protein W